MLLDMPYFMTNEEWYIKSEEKGMYLLTEKAPKEAQESYKEFYEALYNSQNYSDKFEIKNINDYIYKLTQKN